MTGQKILVLGATGLIGSAVAIHLAADNEVHGLSRARSEDAARTLEAHGVKLIRRDAVTDGIEDLDDYDYVFNEILMPPNECHRNADGAFQTHAFLNARLIERFRGCKGIVLGSTGSVYRPSAEPATEDSPLGCNPSPSMENYVLSKICGDKMAEFLSHKLDAPVAILRYYYPYNATPRGMIGSYLTRVTSGEPLKAGEQLVNPLFISDVAELTVRAAQLCKTPPEIINVGGEEFVSVRELVLMIGEAIGKEPALTGSADTAASSWVCDNAKRIQLMGRQKVSLHEGIEETIEATGCASH